MPYDINATLEKLEKNLENLTSAKIQVENTVNASKGLQEVVNGYIASVKALYKEVQSWEKELQNMQSTKSTDIENTFTRLKTACKEITFQFDDVVKNLTLAFESKTNTTIDRFITTIESLDKQIKALKSFQKDLEDFTTEEQANKETLRQISANLNDSQNEQNKILLNITQEITLLKTSITALSKDFHTTLIQTKDNILQSTESIKQTTNNSCHKIKKEINTNRWIIIAGIIILIILHFVTR